MLISQIKPKEFEVGDYVSYEFERKSDKKSGKGIITQITNHCVFIHPDHARYKNQVESIAFAEIHIKETKINRIISNQDIYYGLHTNKKPK